MTADDRPLGRAITVALAGDLMLGRTVNTVAAERGAAYVWGDLLPLLWDADLFLVNLECALTSYTQPWGGGTAKMFYFRADPERVEVLRIGRVDCATIANNHIADFGMTGLLDTVRRLGQAGIAVAGAGGDRATARMPAQLHAGGLRVHVIAFADHPADWAARPFFPGINHTAASSLPDDFKAVEEAIRQARAGADLLVFSMHWGPNMRARPSGEFQRFSRAVIEAGADVFWGHSAHVPQGVEAYGGGLILYDTGDLVDDYVVDPELRNDRSGLFLLRVEPAGTLRLEIVPVRIRSCQANLAVGEDREWVLARIADLSAELGTVLERADGRLVLTVPRRAAMTAGMSG